MALDRNQLLKPAKKLRKLLRKIDNNSTPEEVHDLRTDSRRFEAVFDALSLDKQGIDKAILKDLERLRKRAGKVRDMDVLTGFASRVHPKGEEDCSVRLLEHLGARREKEAAKLSAEASDDRRRVRKELKRTTAVLKKLTRKSGDAKGENDAAAEAAASAVKMAARLGTPPRLTRSNLHPYRLRVKELRSVLRVASNSEDSRFVRDLGDLKDAIGEWHDYEELVSIAQKVLDHPTGCRLLAELKRLARQKYEDAIGQAQRLRKTYLRGKRASAGSARTARPKVWKAISALAG
ncbi:MAG TPA: CHAD domain-containing protein [Bryobacteraceae bacterium]|jgi:CHAD domain-containing protein|nr:CHAD domain-containing protein [Bryobacteraceae bacterium]